MEGRSLLLGLLLLVIPLSVSALTLEEIQAQLKSLLERVSVLKVELEQKEQSNPPLPPHLPCLSLSRTLRIGMEGEDVKKLQEFLIGSGVLGKEYATGYFGRLTESAVQKWQTAAGIVSQGTASTTGFGLVGPKTREAIFSACKNRRVESNDPSRRVCPAEPIAPTSACAGSWSKGLDASGCVTGYICDENRTDVSSASATSSIIVVKPRSGTIVTGGNTLAISWRSENARGNSVSISLVDSEGMVVGEIAHTLAPSGRYFWRVPQGNTDCAQGENAFDCIEKFALCSGSSSICSLSPGTYRVRLSLGAIVSESEPFQIAGTAIASLLQALLGSPSVSSASDTPSIGTTTPRACTHQGVTYPEGSTLSVWCEAGHCLSEGAGYITGTCTESKWCIPFTQNCAKSFSEIDVSSYAAATSTPISSGGSTLNCPQIGWRVYLDCSVLPGCRTGWNVCTGNGWTYDPDQSIR